MAGQSVLSFITQNGQIMGSNSSGTYYQVPKADGGWDFYRILPDGTTISTISYQDVEKALADTRSADIPDISDVPQAPPVPAPPTYIYTGGGGTYTAPSGETYPYSETFLGRTYSNPEEALTAKLAYLTDLYGSKLGEQRRAFKQATGYEDPNKVSYGNVGGTLGEQKTNFLQSIADNIARIQSYYGGLGDIYQSSQGVRLNKQEKQRKQGETGLQRTLTNYLRQYNTGQKDLATQFLQAKDNLANQNETSLQNVLSAGNLPYAAAELPDTGMAPLTTAQGMAQSYRQAGNMFNEGPSATGGKVDVPSILDWLYRQTATK